MKYLLLFFTAITSISVSALGRNELQIIENAGQFKGDFDYLLRTPGTDVAINNTGLYYIFYRRISAQKIERQKISLSLAGCSFSSVPQALESTGYYEMYQGAAFDGEICGGGYKKILYPEIYPGIDWLIYIQDGKLEYDFIAKENGLVSDIRMECGGAQEMNILADGSLLLKNEIGEIRQTTPLCFFNGEKTPARFRMEKGIVSFSVPHAFARPVLIDPVIEWATYYGGSGFSDNAKSLCVDADGNIYMTGLTYTPTSNIIASGGSFKDTISGTTDGFIAKFDPAGNRLWASYYGGNAADEITNVCTDKANNVYAVGTTASDNNIALTGSYQNQRAGSQDGFIVKFNSSGQRIWATYFGGAGNDNIVAVQSDDSCNIYVTGNTESSGISSTNSFQPNLGGNTDAYLARFDSTGNRIWATYFGGGAADGGTGLTVFGGNVYLCGYTASTGLAGNGAFQAGLVGQNNAFLARFSRQGQYLWSTYYAGGTNNNSGANAVAHDSHGNIYMTGTTAAGDDIATPGAHQMTYGGNNDAFLVRFDSSGNRHFSTYIGGVGSDSPGGMNAIAFDKYGYLYLCGFTTSPDSIAYLNAHQAGLSGGTGADGFISKFSPEGKWLWGSYYGGAAHDVVTAISCGGSGDVYIAGHTGSDTGIATSNGFQPLGAQGFAADGLLAKFGNCNTSPVLSLSGDSLIAPPAYIDYQWHENSLPVAGADSFIINGVDSGNFYYLVVSDSNGCTLVSDTISLLLNVAPVVKNFDVCVYPNPAKGLFNVHGTLSESPAAITLLVNDLSGRQVLKKNVHVRNGELREELDLSRMPAGTYILVLQASDKHYSLPLLKY